MIEEGYDLTIRVDPKAGDGLVGRPLHRDRLVVVAAPDMAVPTDGIVPAVLRGGDPASNWTIDTIAGEHIRDRSPAAAVVDSNDPGCGAAWGRGGADAVVSGQLRHRAGQPIAGGDVAASRIVLWALYPTRPMLNARVSGFLEFLR